MYDLLYYSMYVHIHVIQLSLGRYTCVHTWIQQTFTNATITVCCMFACTIVLPYPKVHVPIKISRWDLSKSNSTKRSSKYSPIWKFYLGRLKKKILLLNKSWWPGWHHSKNIKSGLRELLDSHCKLAPIHLKKKYFTLNKWRSRETTLLFVFYKENNIKASKKLAIHFTSYLCLV